VLLKTDKHHLFRIDHIDWLCLSNPICMLSRLVIVYPGTDAITGSVHTDLCSCLKFYLIKLHHIAP